MSKMNQTALGANASAGTQTVVTEKKTACRLFSLLFLIVGAAAFVLPYNNTPLYKAVLEMFSGGWKFDIGNIATCLLAVCLVFTVVLSFIALFTAKRMFAIVSSLPAIVGAIAYTVCAVITAGLDLVSLVLAIGLVVAAIVCIIFTKPTVEVIEEKVAVKEEVDETGFQVEEYAEAYPYEGGPVAGVVMAEEVNPSFLPHEPHVSTAGYDFYNSKSFDPFIAMLNVEERNQFTELFILRFQGMMPELPEYQVGGDNKEFFRKVFIYLGQYRDRIPSGLLGKMYQYSLKLN